MLRFAILELLSHKPLCGCELKKRFGGSIVFFWRAAHSQIYPELKRMEAEGLVSGDKVPHPWRPTKKVYAITEAGTRELVRWLRERTDIQAVKDEMMLKCFAFDLIPPEEAARQIDHHKTLHDRQLLRYREIERDLTQKHGDPLQTSDPIMFWNGLTLQYAIAFEQMYIEWCMSALSQLAAFHGRVFGPGARAETPGRAVDVVAGAGGAAA